VLVMMVILWLIFHGFYSSNLLVICWLDDVYFLWLSSCFDKLLNG